jgi:hypothetical protein
VITLNTIKAPVFKGNLPGTVQAKNSGIISFGYDSPLTEIAHHCAYCGVEIFPSREITHLQEEIISSSGTQLQNVLSKVIKAFYNSKIVNPDVIIFEKLLFLSKKIPAKTGKDLCLIYFNELSNGNMSRLFESVPDTKKIIVGLANTIPLLPEKPRESVREILRSGSQNLLDISKKIKNIQDDALLNNLKLPEEFLNFYKYALTTIAETDIKQTQGLLRKKNPFKLLRLAFEPLLLTLEHVHPHDKNGEDKSSNYLPVCETCNLERKDIDFIDFIKIKPDIKEFIINSLLEVKSIIARLINPPEEMTHYLEDITKTLREESAGQIDIVI